MGDWLAYMIIITATNFLGRLCTYQKLRRCCGGAAVVLRRCYEVAGACNLFGMERTIDQSFWRYWDIGS